VKLAVPHPPEYLTQDMTVSVDIRIAQHPRAVLVPTDAVHDDVDAAGPWVLKVDGHHARRQSVRLGLRGGGLSEVLNGLQPGDQVVPAAADVHDGSRLRPVMVVAPLR
jgi:HlyD family secretion protein